MNPDNNPVSDDVSTVARVLAGDREAFRGLVEKYQRGVFHSALRIVRDPDEAEDLAQEAFVKAFANLSRYDPRWAFSTWLMTIVTRTALNALRGRRGRPSESIEALAEPDQPAEPGAGPRDVAARNEWSDRLRREIDALSGGMRLAFGLRYEDGLSIEEIASATSSTVSAVKVALHRARKILKERLKEFSDFA
jgi:RNA polymerase sigma-70 factor, ECF subfamily